MYVFSRRHAVTTLSAALAAPFLATRVGAQQAVPVLVNRVATDQPLVALTFDDGPHPVLTPQLLDILAAYGARATFYLIGRNAAIYPQIVRRIAAEGHEIGNHSWSHPSLFGYSEAGVLDQIDRTNRAVEAATGRRPATMRPPYGNFHPWQQRMLHAARGMPTVLWSVDTEDWQRPGPAVVAERMVGSMPGAVVLAHDIHPPTLRAMPAAIAGLRARGFRMVQVSELIGLGRWQDGPDRVAGLAVGHG